MRASQLERFRELGALFEPAREVFEFDLRGRISFSHQSERDVRHVMPDFRGDRLIVGSIVLVGRSAAAGQVLQFDRDRGAVIVVRDADRASDALQIDGISASVVSVDVDPVALEGDLETELVRFDDGSAVRFRLVVS